MLRAARSISEARCCPNQLAPTKLRTTAAKAAMMARSTRLGPGVRLTVGGLLALRAEPTTAPPSSFATLVPSRTPRGSRDHPRASAGGRSPSALTGLLGGATFLLGVFAAIERLLGLFDLILGGLAVVLGLVLERLLAIGLVLALLVCTRRQIGFRGRLGGRVGVIERFLLGATVGFCCGICGEGRRAEAPQQSGYKGHQRALHRVVSLGAVGPEWAGVSSRGRIGCRDRS